MGTHFFKPPASHPTAGMNLQARANAAPGYTARGASIGSQKSLAAASAINKAVSALHKPSVRGSAYAPGPKGL